MSTCTGLLALLRPRTEEMLAFIAELVAIESGSYDAQNVALVGEACGARWRALGFEARVPHRGAGHDGLSIARAKARAKLVILGHADTVVAGGTSPAGNSAGRPIRVRPRRRRHGRLAMAWFAKMRCSSRGASSLPRQ